MKETRENPPKTSEPSEPVHSHADPMGDGRLTAPAATRNAPAIVAALAPHMPKAGRVLEIAAGTGQHAVALARANPGLDWQPTDIAPERLASIDAWARAEGLGNIRPAALLDAGTPDWRWPPVAMVFLSNLLHLIPEATARHVIEGAARVLTPGGRLAIYGPFRTDGGFRSEGDAGFHARLVAADPDAGYKDAEAVTGWGEAAGLVPGAMIEMPANNLILLWQKP